MALLRGGQPLPVTHWLTTPWPTGDLQAAAETALHLAASGQAEERPTEIFISHQTIARLDPITARRLQLPPPSPYRLAVEHHGLLSDPHFALRVRFLDDRERPLIGVHRQGTVLTCGDHRFLLSDPVFSALEAIDRFNAHLPLEQSDRLAFLAHLQELLGPPAPARLDDYLKDFRIHRATALAVLLGVDEAGEFTLEPLLLRPWAPSPTEEDTSIPGDTPPEYVVALSHQQHRAFARQLQRRAMVLDRFAFGGGEYLILSPQLQKVVAAVRRLNSLPAEQRLAFLRAPHSHLREALPDCSDEEFDALVVDCESLSERVSHLGQWLGVAVPPTPPSGVRWVPDQVPFVIAGHVVPLALDQLPDLLERLLDAQRVRQEHLTVNGVHLPVTHAVIVAVQRILAFLGLQEDQPGPLPAPPSPPPRLAIHILDNIQRGVFRAQLRPRTPVHLSPSLTGTPLLPHQGAGLTWLAESWRSGWPGVLVADDMGLGKTLQALAFMAALQNQSSQAGSVAPMLVVAPTGLLANWRAEAERHGLLATLGEPLDLSSLRVRNLGELAEQLRKATWVLVSYERLRDYQRAFVVIPWTLVVFDEAQRMKNPAARLTNAAKALKSAFVLALTATPLENSLADLWCIVDAVAPGTLGSLTGFLRWCARPEQLARLPEYIAHPRDGLPPLMLRRLKADSLPGLPPKQHMTYRRAMPEVQAAAYAKTFQQTRGIAGRSGILAAIQRFRNVSLDPLPQDWYGSDEEYLAASARLSALVEILDRVAAEGEKALVFVDSLHVQARLLGVLQRRYRLPTPPLVINGQVAGRDRLARVELFQQRHGFDVMLLSPRAGGVGLNLMAANHVVHLARWWNPAVEDQCTDRVFRIGQERPVFVHYPLAIHPGLGAASFDLRLDALLKRKRELAARALAPVAPTVEELADLIR